MPESPRYLLAKNKLNEAHKLFKMVARFNRKVAVIDNEESEKKSDLNDNVETSSKAELFKYFRSFINILRVGMVAYIWIAVSLVYYGVSLGKFYDGWVAQSNSIDLVVRNEPQNAREWSRACPFALSYCNVPQPCRTVL